MWKRFPLSSNRGKENQIGPPVLIETTYDEKVLNRIPNVSDLQGVHPSLSTRPAFGRRRPDEALHEMPQHSHIPLRPRDPNVDAYDGRRLPDPRLSVDTQNSQAPSPSLYSQPGSDWLEQSAALQWHSKYQEVSPPSSPVQPTQRRAKSPPSRSVSPVADLSDASRSSSKAETRYQSHIPVLRKVSARIPSNTTRWDDFTGEPTSSSSGKPPQQQPSETYSNPFDSPSTGNFGYQVSISGGGHKPKKAPLLQRGLGRESPTPAPKAREPWRGASGRHAIMDPLPDKPRAAGSPLAIPSHRKGSPALSEGSGSTTPSSATVATARRVPIRSETSKLSETPVRQESKIKHESRDSAIKPIVPLKIEKTITPPGSRSVSSPVRSATNGSSVTTGLSRTNSTTHSNAAGAGPSRQRSKPIRRKSIDTIRSIPHTADNYEQPVSRFSWTTYATSTTYQRSPPSSPPPPLPSSIPNYKTPSPIMNRRRPIPSSANAAPASPTPSRKPVATPNTMNTTNTTGTAIQHRAPSGAASTFSTATKKALPAPPTALASSDLVGTLEAQMDDLALRRGNIRRVLRDFAARENKNPLVTDLAMRKDTSRKIRDMEEELAEIASQEHEIGLRLHRAYKRRERNSNMEQNQLLWIRRVTS